MKNYARAKSQADMLAEDWIIIEQSEVAPVQQNNDEKHFS